MTVNWRFKRIIQSVKMVFVHIEELKILFPVPDHMYYCYWKTQMVT